MTVAGASPLITGGVLAPPAGVPEPPPQPATITRIMVIVSHWLLRFSARNSIAITYPRNNAPMG